jgi:hypothetical protein
MGIKMSAQEYKTIAACSRRPTRSKMALEIGTVRRVNTLKQLGYWLPLEEEKDIDATKSNLLKAIYLTNTAFKTSEFYRRTDLYTRNIPPYFLAFPWRFILSCSQHLHYVAPNGSITDEWWIGKDLAGGDDLLGTIPTFLWRVWGKERSNLVKITRVGTEIGEEHFSNISLELYHYASRLRFTLPSASVTCNWSLSSRISSAPPKVVQRSHTHCCAHIDKELYARSFTRQVMCAQKAVESGSWDDPSRVLT